MGEAGKAKGPVDASPGRTPGKRRVQWTLRPAERRESEGSSGRFARPNAGKAEGPVDASPGRTPEKRRVRWTLRPAERRRARGQACREAVIRPALRAKGSLLGRLVLPQIGVGEDKIPPRAPSRLGMDTGNTPQLQPEGLDQPAAHAPAGVIGRKAHAVICDGELQLAARFGRQADPDHPLLLGGEGILEDIC